MSDDARLQRLSRELFLAAFAPPGATDIEPWLRQRLMASFEEFTLDAGERLFSEGDPADYVYFVRDGSFRTERAGAPTITFNGRWVLGSFDLLASRARTRTATALRRVDVVRLPAEEWMDLLEDSFSLSRTVVLNIALGVSKLYERLPPNGGIPDPDPAASLDLSSGPLDLLERSLVFMQVPLLRGAGIQALTDIAANAEELTLEPGQALGDPAREDPRLFLVAEGMVEARLERHELVARFGPASLVFGAAAFVPDAGGWRAEAVTRTRVLALTLEEWVDQMEEHFEAVRTTLRMFAVERERLVDEIARRAGELVLT